MLPGVNARDQHLDVPERCNARVQHDIVRRANGARVDGSARGDVKQTKVEDESRLSAGAKFGIALTLAVFMVPVLFDLSFNDQTRPFGYLAADSFAYLTVARNFLPTRG